MLKIDEIACFMELKNVNNSPDKTEYKKFGQDFFDSEILEDRLYYYLWSSFKYDGEVSTITRTKHGMICARTKKEIFM